MTAAKRERVSLFFAADGRLTLTTNNLATIESCLRFVRHAATTQLAAPEAAERHRVIIACEEIQASMQLLWTGQDAATKNCRVAVFEVLFNTRSWSKIEYNVPLATLEAGLAVLHACEAVSPVPQTRGAVIPFLLDLQSKAVGPAADPFAAPLVLDAEAPERADEGEKADV